MLRNELATEELRAFLADLKNLADEAGIELELPKIDIGEEFIKAVNRALDRNSDPSDMNPSDF